MDTDDIVADGFRLVGIVVCVLVIVIYVAFNWR